MILSSTTLFLLPLLLTLAIVSSAHALFQPFTLGTFNGTVVSDGVFTFCTNPYKVDDRIVKRVLSRSRNQVYPHTLAENVVVIDINGRRVIVDTGVSHNPFIIPGTEDGAQLATSMSEAGISPESIDVVLLTHAHSDHAFGLVALDGTAAFPNAVIYISKIDHEFWANPTFDTELPDDDVVRKLSLPLFCGKDLRQHNANRLRLKMHKIFFHACFMEINMPRKNFMRK